MNIQSESFPEENKGLILMTWNPFHNGHLALVRKTIECGWVDTCDIYVWNRAKPWTLPHEVRLQSITEALDRNWFSDTARVISNRNEQVWSILELQPENYTLLAVGSDLANSFDPETWKLREYEREHFLRFRKILIMERGGVPINPVAHAFLRTRIEALQILPAESDLSGTAIRNFWLRGEDIRPHLPAGVFENIEPHLSVFQSQNKANS